MHNGKSGRSNGSQKFSSGQQRIRSGLSATPQGRMEREAQKASAPPSAQPPIIEAGRGIPRMVLMGKISERGRGDLGFPDRV